MLSHNLSTHYTTKTLEVEGDTQYLKVSNFWNAILMTEALYWCDYVLEIILNLIKWWWLDEQRGHSVDLVMLMCAVHCSVVVWGSSG